MNEQSVKFRLDPSKRYYRVREASAMAGVPAYVLRFWESQFPALKPKRTASGHRIYRESDVNLILEIKRLLYDRHFTIEGARQHLETPPAAAASSEPETDIVIRIYQELKDLRRLLDDPP